jgi:molybdopterin molybdotransferase
MITVEQHLELVLAQCEPRAAVTVPLAAARGLVLAAPVLARHELPPFESAAMDGYAVRAQDVAEASPETPARLGVVADVAAGSQADPRLAAGEAARIMTGAVLPTDADAVVPLEQTASGALFPACGDVEVTRAVSRGAHVRPAGEEARRGDRVLSPGVVLTPRRLAAAAAAGHAELPVHPAPRVAVLATGDELVTPGLPLGRGQLAESNSTMLAGIVESGGGAVARADVLGDRPEALRARVAELEASVDVIVLTGGVGSGAYDVVRNAFRDVLAFREVAMQPGRPQAFGRLPAGPLVFGLPGNPAAAAVAFEVFVRPALARLRGLGAEQRTFEATAAQGWRGRADRRQYLPVVVAGDTVRPAGAGRSHLVVALAGADGYAVVPLGVAEVRPGDRVTVLRASGDE